MSKKINTLNINSDSIVGGGMKMSFLLLSNVLLSDDFNFFSFFPMAGPAITNLHLEKDKIFIPSKSGFLKNIVFIFNIIKNNNFNIIHAHGTRAAFWSRLAIIFIKDKPKLIYTIHGFHLHRKAIPLNFFLLLIERFLNNWTDILVCVSDADKEIILKYKLISDQKIKIIKNGVEIDKFSPSISLVEEEKRKLLGGYKGLVLVKVARLDRPKDHTTVLRALKLLVDNNITVKLLLIGKGSLCKKLKEKVRYLNLENNVLFLGSRENVPILLSLSDIVLLSTEKEGLPLAVLEAGAAGKPIVASRVAGVEEVVINKETGFLFEFGNEYDLADKILLLMKNDKLINYIGQKAFKYIEDNFSAQRMATEHKKLYLDLIKYNSR